MTSVGGLATIVSEWSVLSYDSFTAITAISAKISLQKNNTVS